MKYKKRTIFTGTLAFITVFWLLATASITSAQESAGENVLMLDPFLITGSQITRFDTETTLPITQVDTDTILEDGFSTSGEIFSELVFTGAAEFNESEDGPNDARGDVTSVNLRSLGSAYTLVLLNGRRLAPHPLNQTIDSTPSVLVNANIVPAGLIDRIEVLRDGASAIYGTDASAGVVNTILEQDLTGQRLRARYGFTEEGDFDEYLIDYTGGFDFNDGATNVTIFASYFERDPILTGDRDYAALGDKRPLVPEWFQGDTSIQNVSSSSFYTNLGTVDGARIRIDGATFSNSRGQFHIEPPGSGGTRAVLNTGLGVDDGSLPRSERYDTVPLRTLTSSAERSTFFATVNHDFSETLRVYGELGYYDSETFLARAPSNISSSAALTIPAQNYYNPFGPVTFADGSPNPNRLDGITIGGDPLPEEGIPLLVRNWRAEDFGQRLVTVENESLIATAGLAGFFNDSWYWDTGIRYNRNEANDSETGRLSKTGFEDVLGRSTPNALNLFGGPGVNDPADFESAFISVERTGVTDLVQYDFKANSPDIFEWNGNPIGVAFGFEVRQESYEDDRDPRLDGTIRFDDSVNGESDVIGVSPTPDTEADRTVYGAFVEALIPIFGEANRQHLLHRLELQLAGRFEDYDDFGTVTKPKIGVAWYPSPDVLFRASFAQGFTAPNLSLLTQPIQRSNEGIEDTYRIEFDPSNPENDGTDPVSELRGGGDDLGPEESETYTLGAVWRVPEFEGLTLGIDYFNIKINDIIRIDNTEDVLEREAAIGQTLGFDPSVSVGDAPQIADFVRRRPLTQADIDLAQSQGVFAVGAIDLVFNTFENRSIREVGGFDYFMEYVFSETDIGQFTLRGTASFLSHYREQEVDGGPVNNSILGDADRAQPRFRGRTSLAWRKDNWRASLSARYISKVVDNDVDSDADLDPSGESNEWVVDPYLTLDSTVSYRFSEGPFDGTRLLLGVRNLFNQDPPLNPDESYGYESALHSNRGRYFYAEVRYDF